MLTEQPAQGEAPAAVTSPPVSHSTAEAEYVAASMGCREEIFVSELMEDLGHKVNKPMPIYLDSKSAIDMAFDPVSFKKTKHILRDAYYL